MLLTRCQSQTSRVDRAKKRSTPREKQQDKADSCVWGCLQNVHRAFDGLSFRKWVEQREELVESWGIAGRRIT